MHLRTGSQGALPRPLRTAGPCGVGLCACVVCARAWTLWLWPPTLGLTLGSHSPLPWRPSPGSAPVPAPRACSHWEALTAPRPAAPARPGTPERLRTGRSEHTGPDAPRGAEARSGGQAAEARLSGRAEGRLHEEQTEQVKQWGAVRTGSPGRGGVCRGGAAGSCACWGQPRSWARAHAQTCDATPSVPPTERTGTPSAKKSALIKCLKLCCRTGLIRAFLCSPS